MLINAGSNRHRHRQKRNTIKALHFGTTLRFEQEVQTHNMKCFLDSTDVVVYNQFEMNVRSEKRYALSINSKYWAL